MRSRNCSRLTRPGCLAPRFEITSIRAGRACPSRATSITTHSRDSCVTRITRRTRLCRALHRCSSVVSPWLAHLVLQSIERGNPFAIFVNLGRARGANSGQSALEFSSQFHSADYKRSRSGNRLVRMIKALNEATIT